MITSVTRYPEFDLARLLKTVFEPLEGNRVCLLIDLKNPSTMQDYAFLDDPDCPVQQRAHTHFYQALHDGVMEELGLTGGEMFAYRETGGSNLNLPEDAVDAGGNTLSLEKDIFPNYDLILCISNWSATAPLTAFAKQYGFRGSTMHGLNDIILSSGLCVDYRDVSKEAEKLRLGVTKADAVEIDFEVAGSKHTLRLELGGQEAQKSHGLCRGTAPDIANLPAGEVYFVPTGADGEFPMKYEADGTIGLQHVKNGRIVEVTLVSGNPETIKAHKATLAADPVTGEIGELGLGTQELPFSGADIQDEKVLGTCHVATGRSDHLGGHLTPDLFEEAQNASHDDILFHPQKTPEIQVRQVRMYRGEQQEVLIEDYQPAEYFKRLLKGTARTP